MPQPREPDPNRDVPMPAPTWKPEPIEEPEPEGLPDETPLPNPDENEEPPVQATSGSQARGRKLKQSDN
ncbi:hypothetical protein NKI20_25230 [Mesorhizobium sp. M0830]|uniref:hypothetical protein n=1 Tax=Mesorhizobium sp. M0830 TaxID=2957008 RepID=UPI00333D4906